MSLKPYRNDLIKGAMAANDITTKMLAESTSLSTDTLSRIRNGEVNITLTNLIAVVDALGLSMKDLFTPKVEEKEHELAQM